MSDTPVIVNGRSRIVTSKTVSYEDVVRLAYEHPPKSLMTVTFRRGRRKNAEGAIAPGDIVPVKDGMIFNVYDTSRA